MSKYYAVRKGLVPGIYLTWDECKVNVLGFPKAEYKSFGTKEDAEEYLGISRPKETTAKERFPFAYIDGSYNMTTKKYGYGGYFMDMSGKRNVLQGVGDKTEYAEMRNISGEILGALAAVKFAMTHNIKKFTLYYDYAGIENWATGTWKTYNPITTQYAALMQKAIASGIEIVFHKVKGHTGVSGNELADLLAKQAVDISLTSEELKLLEKYELLR